jgi:alpha-tubulin suppressor-like RCC1 family protein
MVRVFSGHSASHVFFLNELGDVYVMGRNEQGQCGLTTNDHGTVISTATRLDRRKHFKPELLEGSEGDIVYVSCGRSHTLLCTRAGAVYSAGKNALGQCGHSNLGDVQGFKKIEVAPFVREKDPVIQVAAGITFSLICTKSGKGE